jgi:hypothetical protein
LPILSMPLCGLAASSILHVPHCGTNRSLAADRRSQNIRRQFNAAGVVTLRS